MAEGRWKPAPDDEYPTRCAFEFGPGRRCVNLWWRCAGRRDDNARSHTWERNGEQDWREWQHEHDRKATSR